MGRLAESADLLVAVLGKHVDLCQSRPNVTQARSALPDI